MKYKIKIKNKSNETVNNKTIKQTIFYNKTKYSYNEIEVFWKIVYNKEAAWVFPLWDFLYIDSLIFYM